MVDGRGDEISSVAVVMVITVETKPPFGTAIAADDEEGVLENVSDVLVGESDDEGGGRFLFPWMEVLGSGTATADDVDIARAVVAGGGEGGTACRSISIR